MALNIKMLALSLLVSISSFAQQTPSPTPGPHDHHRRHFMVLAGDAEVFAYHYVYKVPHNYQVILRVRFDDVTFKRYVSERQGHPKDIFFFYLDKMEIAKVDSVTELVGSLVREDAAGVQTELLTGVKVSRADFDLLFFDEVPVKLD